MINEERAKAYCCEDISLIENYEQAVADQTRIWHCHHRLEIQGQFKNSKKLLIRCGLYYGVPAWQLVFMTHTEHIRLHNTGVKRSALTCKKISEALKGRRLSEETK